MQIINLENSKNENIKIFYTGLSKLKLESANMCSCSLSMEMDLI